MEKQLFSIFLLLTSLLICPWVSMQADAQGSVDHFVFDNISSPQTAGESFNVTITAKDSSGKSVTDYNGTPTLTYSAGLISPASATGGFTSGFWTGIITVTAAGSSVTVTATDGSHSWASNPFTVNPVITVSQGINGIIVPGTTSVNYGASQNFTITPFAGYFINTVIVDGSSVPVPYTNALSYRFSDVRESHLITATFETAKSTPPITTPIPTLAPTPTTSPSSVPSLLPTLYPTASLNQSQTWSKTLLQGAAYGIVVILIALVITAVAIMLRKSLKGKS